MFKMEALTAATALVVATVSSSVTYAEPSHVSDAQFIAASRCEALMASSALGRQDTHDVDQFLKAQAGGRDSEVFDRADEARQKASMAANRSGPSGKAALIAERDGACRALTGATSYAGAASPAGSSRSN